eukprot:234845-Alexandrium_andersonii.AAC.1
MVPCVAQKQKLDRPAKVLGVEVPDWMPHEVFAHYFATDRARFDYLLFGKHGGDNDRDAFWKTLLLRKGPRLENHPMTRREDWARRAVPISLHGDGVPALQVDNGARSH